MATTGSMAATKAVPVADQRALGAGIPRQGQRHPVRPDGLDGARQADAVIDGLVRLRHRCHLRRARDSDAAGRGQAVGLLLVEHGQDDGVVRLRGAVPGRFDPVAVPGHELETDVGAWQHHRGRRTVLEPRQPRCGDGGRPHGPRVAEVFVVAAVARPSGDDVVAPVTEDHHRDSRLSQGPGHGQGRARATEQDRGGPRCGARHRKEGAQASGPSSTTAPPPVRISSTQAFENRPSATART